MRPVSIAAVALLGLGACTTSSEPGTENIEFIDLRVEEINTTRAAVRFTTSVPTSCILEYGTTSMFGETATDPDMEPGERAIEHDLPLEDLTPGVTYFFRAKATGATDTTVLSEMRQFSTLFAADPTATMHNVALLSEGASVTTVSSNWSNAGNQSSYGINNAVDGSMSTEWSTAGDGNDAAVTLNFGQMRTIKYFGYRSRMMTDGTSIVTRVRLLIANGSTVLGPFETPDHTVRYLFAFDPPITVQEVRFEAVDTTGGNTGAKEIQFFAD